MPGSSGTCNHESRINLKKKPANKQKTEKTWNATTSDVENTEGD
jgi:hypothetical protein